MKPGVFTTEFWATVVAIVGLVVLSGLDKLTPEVIAAIAGPTGIYAVSRGLAKRSNESNGGAK